MAMFQVRENVNFYEALVPASGQHLLLIPKSGTNYWYALYMDAGYDIWLSWSTDGTTWTPGNRVSVATSDDTYLMQGASMCADYSNNQIYVGYEYADTTNYYIDVVQVDVDSAPTSPSVGTAQNIANLDDYHAPVCDLATDGGLWVGAVSMDIAPSDLSQYYVIKSGISVGEPDLTSWSSAFNVDSCNSTTKYGSMRLFCNKNTNRIVVFFIDWGGGATPNIYRSINVDGVWNNWTAGQDVGLNAEPVALNTWNDCLTKTWMDLSQVPGDSDAWCLFADYTASVNGCELWTYDFSADDGTGTFAARGGCVQKFDLGSTSFYNGVALCAILAPGDTHVHCFYKDQDNDICYIGHSEGDDTETSITVLAAGSSTENKSLDTVPYAPSGTSQSDVIGVWGFDS